jgi:hypothetical protein
VYEWPCLPSLGGLGLNIRAAVSEIIGAASELLALREWMISAATLPSPPQDDTTQRSYLILFGGLQSDVRQN